MKNTFKNMPSDVKARAERVIQQLELRDFLVSFNAEKKSLKFRADFKELTVPLVLIDEDRWVDIRHLYRATCKPEPQVKVFPAESEWSRAEFKK